MFLAGKGKRGISSLVTVRMAQREERCLREDGCHHCSLTVSQGNLEEKKERKKIIS